MTAQGSKQAFQHITQRCNQRLFRVAISVLNNDADAQDALQDAYINAYLHIASFKGDAKLTTWLTRIVLNECYARLRKQRPTVELDELDDSQQSSCQIIHFPNKAPSSSNPESTMAQNEMRKILEQAISQLPENYRTIFVLREIEGFSTEEAANILDISIDTAKQRLSRARKQLRVILDQQMQVSLEDTFIFLGDRCAAMTERVMQQIDEL